MRRLYALKRFIMIWLSAGIMVGAFATAHAATATAPSLVVKMADGLTADQQTAVVARNGGVETATISILRMHVISIPTGDPTAVLQKYQSDPQVERAELNKTRKSEGLPSDTHYSVQWALSKIGWDSVFDSVVPTRSAKVAILDTGIDASHPDLHANVIEGTSILDGSSGSSDANGHGTSLAGIVAAVTNNDLGIAGLGFSGVQIMPVTVLNASGIGQDSDIIAGVIWAADHGADVILMGFSNADFSHNLQDAIDYAWAKGAVLVAATGNDGLSTPTFPAGARGVVGVSATDEDDALAFGSNSGQDTFLSAPGTNVYTTAPGGSYTYITGTSASSAMVAGAAALIKAVDPALTNGVIVGRLAKSAAAVGTAGDPANQSHFGNGRLDLAAAVASTSTESVQPTGAAPVGSGGPYVGPYAAADSILESVRVGNQSGSLTSGKAGSATYVVTVTRSGAGVLNVTLTLPIALPGGATATFNPATVSFTGNAPTSATSTLTITTVGTTPAGSSTFTVKGTSASQAASSEPVTLTITEPVYQKATISFSNLTRTYTGAALTPTVDTEPSGLHVDFSGTPMIDAGSYMVTATVNDGAYRGSASTSFTIEQASATIDVKGYSGTYDATSHGASGTATGVNGENLSTYLHLGATFSDAPGGTAEWTFDGNTNYKSAKGSAAITINQAAATVALSDLTQTYTGNQLKPVATTTPAGLSIDWNGASQTDAGSYPVTATIKDSNYSGSASGNFIIEKAAATIDVKGYNGTYDAAPHGASGSAKGVKGEDLGSLLDLGATFTDAPGGTAQWSFKGNANYKSASGNTAITISKASATVALTGLSQSYDGSARTVTATTDPAGKVVSITYDGSTSAPVNAGRYAIAATIKDTNYDGSATGTLVVAKATATIALLGLTQTYDGSARVVSASTTPQGKGVTILYDGLTTAPTAAGTYGISATIDDPNYQGSASGTLTVSKAAATVALSGLTQTYDGSAKAVTATTNPAGKAVTITYDGAASAPTGAGSYAVVATVTDRNYEGSATGTLTVAKATATVTLNGLSQKYDGTARTVTATTDPAGKAVSITYDGNSAVPINIGSYAIAATVTDANYEGSATGTLTVAKGSATINLTNVSQTYSGSRKYVTATTIPPGLNVAITYNGSTSAPTNAGSYPVVATINDGNFEGSISGTLNIAKGTASVYLSGLSKSYDGSPKSVTVTTTPAGKKVDVTYNGSATVPTGIGSYTVVATINDINYQGSTSGTFNITKGTATVTLNGLIQPYDGSPKAVTATTNPPGLTVDITYKGSPTAPSSMGSYPVVATVRDATYQGSASGTLGILTPLPAPASITVPSGNSSGSITVTWTGSGGYSGLSYVLEYSSDKDPTWRTAYSGTYNYAYMNVTNATYSFRVKETMSGYADSPYTLSATNCVVFLACDPPSYVTAPANSSTGSVTVNWGGGNVPGLTYSLEYSIAGSDKWVPAYTGIYGYANLNLPNGTYVFRVRNSKDGYRTSDYTLSGTCKVQLACDPPSYVTAPASSTGTVTVNWGGGNVSGVTYSLDYSIVGSNNWVPAYTGTYSYAYLNLPNGNYLFRVRSARAGYDTSDYTLSSTCLVVR